MTLREFYTATGGDYEGTLARLITEARIRKFVLKFKDDPSFHELCSALERKDVQSAFMAAHTLKGVSQNLGFDRLYRPAAEVTETLRAGVLADGANVEKLKAHYEAIICALADLDE